MTQSGRLPPPALEPLAARIPAEFDAVFQIDPNTGLSRDYHNDYTGILLSLELLEQIKPAGQED